jgi:hypothetical protein
MLVPIGDISSTMSVCVHLLNYAAKHPDAVVQYTASNMQLHMHSDASYLSAPNSRSRLDGKIANDPTRAPNRNNAPPPFNVPVLVNANISQVIVASAIEAKFVAIFQTSRTPSCVEWYLKISVILNRIFPFKPTIPAQLELSTAPSSNAAPKPWTSYFIGFSIGLIKANFLSNGAKAPTMMPIILKSIICRHITGACTPGTVPPATSSGVQGCVDKQVSTSTPEGPFPKSSTYLQHTWTELRFLHVPIIRATPGTRHRIALPIIESASSLRTS